MTPLREPGRELLEACKGGDEIAFREIFHRYRGYAYNLIYKVTGPGADHEDLIQEVFFQVYLSLRTFKGESSFKTWFHRIILNTCSARWRHDNAGKRISGKDQAPLEELDRDPAGAEMSPSTAYELKQLVENALATLDEKLRVPLVLSVYGEMELQEIGQVLGIPEGTVKSRLFTARQKVREYLDKT